MQSVGILYVPSDYGAPRPGIAAAWRRHVVANAAPRDASYMRALFAERFPGGTIVEIADDRSGIALPDEADTIVLLYPDAIGLDFGRIERRVDALAGRRRVLILNGRRRLMDGAPAERRRLALRRFLERSRVVEFAIVALVVTCTPVLALADYLRGHR